VRRLLLLLVSLLTALAVLVGVPSASTAAGTGVVSGTVTLSHDTDVEYYVHAYRQEGAGWVVEGTSPLFSTSSYERTGLTAGTYRFRLVFMEGDYASEYWDGRATLAEGDEATVSDGATADVDWSPVALGRISGTLFAAGGGVANRVVPHAELMGPGGPVTTGSGAGPTEDGTFSLFDLPAGTYRIGFTDWASYYPTVELGRRAWATEYWDDQRSPQQATLVTLAEGEHITGLDAVLTSGAEIAGRVTDPYGVGVAAVRVTVLQLVDGVLYPLAFGAVTRGDGSYRVRGLAPGTYRLRFDPTLGRVRGEEWGNEIKLGSGGIRKHVDASLRFLEPHRVRMRTRPVLRGDLDVGEVLSVSRGGWRPRDVTLVYRWFVGGRRVTSATGNTLLLRPAHRRKVVVVRVVAKAPDLDRRTVTLSRRGWG
jgi:Carboxypeptidase regulatory-like domain